MRWRHVADYQPQRVSAKIAQRSLAKAKDFVETVEAMLGGNV
jgi:hypothetical protein